MDIKIKFTIIFFYRQAICIFIKVPFKKSQASCPGNGLYC